MNRELPKRRTARLADFDYASPGAYFITVVTQERRGLFGDVNSGVMDKNAAGAMVTSWWAELVNKFPSVQLDAFVVMPNHVHGIIELSLGKESDGRPHRGAPTLGQVVGWFKAMTTNAYIKGVKQQGWPPFSGRLWQRGYYEHIVRSEAEFEHIRDYITGNPGKWEEDAENPRHQRRG